MSPISLGQYFRSFLVKLSMIESQLGELGIGGSPRFSLYIYIYICNIVPLDNISFGIVLELKDDRSPSVTHGKVLNLTVY
jgi:mitotic spindle assembly checkpoint protein MAD2B